jgi:formylglycine-generating enzyme required for sulfatase activity
MAMRAPSVWDGKESSADYARRCGLEPTKTLDLGDGMKLELVLVPAGRFTMGSADAEDGRSSDERQHQVTLSRPFYAGKYEVTQAQFQKVMASNPSKYAGDDRPVERVAWATAKEFCRRLGESTKTAVDLPTEAEWEFACRAGTDMRYYAGQTKESLATAGWYTDNSDGTTHPVGRKVGNSFGLYDMIGNVWEWCNDWYGEYPRDSVTDPGGPASGSQRIIRGGSWWSYSWKCRSAARDDFGVNSLDSTVGFRVVVRVAPTK